MRIIPKKTKFKLTFRNKIQTQKIIKYDHTVVGGLIPLWLHDNRNHQNRTQAGRHKHTQYKIYYDLAQRANIAMDSYLAGWYQSSNSSAVTLLAQSGNSYNAIDSKYKSNLQNRVLDHSAYVSYDYTKNLLFGKYGIIFQNHGLARSKYVETLRLDIAKQLKKKAKVWLRICCDTPVTSRPVETRMGKGKGAISHYEAKVAPGQVFFEFDGLHLATMQQIFQNVSKKSGLKLKLVSR
jgi:large subunit ribosomal protein L16